MLNCWEFSMALTRRPIVFDISGDCILSMALFEIFAINFVLHQSEFSSGSCWQSMEESDWNFIGPNRDEGCYYSNKWLKLLYTKHLNFYCSLEPYKQYKKFFITCDFAIFSSWEILKSKVDSFAFWFNISWWGFRLNPNNPGSAVSFFSCARWKLPSLMRRWKRYVYTVELHKSVKRVCEITFLYKISILYRYMNHNIVHLFKTLT